MWPPVGRSERMTQMALRLRMARSSSACRIRPDSGSTACSQAPPRGVPDDLRIVRHLRPRSTHREDECGSLVLLRQLGCRRASEIDQVKP